MLKLAVDNNLLEKAKYSKYYMNDENRKIWLPNKRNQRKKETAAASHSKNKRSSVKKIIRKI